MSDGLPSVRIEIPANEWEVFRNAFHRTLGRMYVDRVTIRHSQLVGEAFLAAHKGRRKTTKTPATVFLPRECLSWVSTVLLRASREARQKVQFFENRTTLERRAFRRIADAMVERLEGESRKTFIDLIGDLG